MASTCSPRYMVQGLQRERQPRQCETFAKRGFVMMSDLSEDRYIPQVYEAEDTEAASALMAERSLPQRRAASERRGKVAGTRTSTWQVISKTPQDFPRPPRRTGDVVCRLNKARLSLAPTWRCRLADEQTQSRAGESRGGQSTIQRYGWPDA
jgi:hypothetical protein